jgi:uncharacterized membrane protein YraQ (UPF0718 family)
LIEEGEKMEFLLNMLRGGLKVLQDYILTHTLTCIVTAFFIAEAMSALFPKDKIMKYLGKKTKAYVSYKPLTINSAESMLRRRVTGRMLVQEVI